MPDDDGSSSNSDSPSILSTVCTLATGAAIVAAGFGIPILSAASTGLSSLSNALGRSERELPDGSASGAGGAGPTPTAGPVNGETEFPMPPTTQTAADAATGAEWLRQAGSGGGRGHTRARRFVDAPLVDRRADAHKTFVVVRNDQHKCSGTVVDTNMVLTAAHCTVKDQSAKTEQKDLLPTKVYVGDKAYDCELSIPGDYVRIQHDRAANSKTNKDAEGESSTKSRTKRSKAKTEDQDLSLDLVLCTTNQTMEDVQTRPNNDLKIVCVLGVQEYSTSMMKLPRICNLCLIY